MSTKAAVVLGVIAGFVGLVIACAGTALVVVFGSDGTISSNTHTLATSTTALVANLDDIDGAADLAGLVGSQHIGVSVAATEQPVFVAVGHAADVDRYLAGAAVDEVTDLDTDPFRLETVPHPGGRPAPPGEQTFWIASAVGRAPQFSWKLRDGNYRVVLMNADGSPAVTTRARLAVTLDKVFPVGLGLMIAGTVLVVGSVVVLAVGRAAARRARVVG